MKYQILERVKITMNLNKPDELTIHYKNQFHRAHFVAITASPIEYLVVGGSSKIRKPYTIQFVDTFRYFKNARYDLVITSGYLRLNGLVFSGTAVLSLE